MSSPRKYLKIVSQLVTPGAVGVALTLGAAVPAAASTEAADAALLQREPVAERLAAIREAVSEIAGAEAQAKDPTAGRRLAWLNWRNGGWGGGGWGWGGRPWGGGPWGGWGGPWNNWHNWNNWRNFWSNY